jgi:hypothetical protein
MFNSMAAYEVSEMYCITLQQEVSLILRLSNHPQPYSDPLLLSYATDLISWHIHHNVGLQDLISDLMLE